MTEWAVNKENDELIVKTVLVGASEKLRRLQSELVADERVRAFERL
jgi:hypothetical protein